MAPWKMYEEGWTPAGRRARFIIYLPGGWLLVQVAFLWNEDQTVVTWGGYETVPTLYHDPPTELYAEEVQVLRAEIAELTKERDAVREEIQADRLEHQHLLANASKIEPLRLINEVLEGVVTCWAIHVNGTWTIKSPQDAVRDTGGKVNHIPIVTLYTNPHKLESFRFVFDGLPGTSAAYPFRCLGDARDYIRERICDRLAQFTAQPSMVPELRRLVESAREFGVDVSSTLTTFMQSQEAERLQDTIAAKVRELDAAREELRKLTGSTS